MNCVVRRSRCRLRLSAADVVDVASIGRRSSDRIHWQLLLQCSSTRTLFIFACLLVFVTIISGSSFVLGDDLASDEQYEERGLFPPTFNLASSAEITTNATCGETAPETFCKLVEHVRAPQCGVCDAKSFNESQRHPITNAIDETTRWWQSPSLQNGRQFETITVTLDLKQVYQVAYVIVKAANSPRPGNWILERSVDGVRYKPWLYFAMSDNECFDTYGVRPTIGIPRFRSDDEVICTSRYSRLEPLENGEIHMSLVKGRPGVSGPSDKLLEFTAARYVRLRLQKIRTLQGDLMILATNDWERIHKTVTRRLFYSIKDISIGGQCMCFGHAKDCPTDQHTGRLKCRCVHNTCGDSCEKCCPLYNQKPWKVGTTLEAGICEKCQCHGHANECYYDKDVATKRESLSVDGKFDGGGVCVNCTMFTTGYNCERCIEDYYRPEGVSPETSEPCLPCVCDGAGITGRCIADANRMHLGLNPGDCICKEGFTGPRCSQCAIGYRNYPMCDLCPCNAAGTLNTDCEGDCICKSKVDGVRCDRCKPGYFNLDRANPTGCTECYCFGVSSKCVSANLGVQLISSLHGWLVSDLIGQKVIHPFTEQGILTVANDEMTGHEAYYWRSPPNFTGNRLHSYGGRLHFHAGWVHARGDSAGWPTKGPVLVLDGGGLLVAYGESVPRRPSEVVADVELNENGFYHLSPVDAFGLPRSTPEFTRGPPVTRRDFIRVLLSLESILIQAKFHTDQIVGKLLSVSLEIGTDTLFSVKRMRNVEKCSCPIGYLGLSCESCDIGYRRVNGTLDGGICRKCDCHGHVNTCDPYTGECQECLHDTAGQHCERCRQGFYGLATKGTPHDCRPCVCPLKDPRNNFSPTCDTRVTNETSGEIDYVCTSCPIGYEGDKCQRCADGFFGNPMVPGNNCQPCQCHGHLDVTMKGSCDRHTGHCLKCTGNTVGFKCEQCLDGFYGNPLEGDCTLCKCNPYGSETVNNCNKTTGECVCRRRYEGATCDRCIEHFGNVEGGCEACDCHVLGSESSLCSPISGQCSCKPGVFGFKCDTCREGYFSFSDAGCEWCNCNGAGSRNRSCHPYTGQCFCEPHVGGRRCDTCLEGFWNMTMSLGCKPCSCNTTGSKTRSCNYQTGQCECEEGVSGLHCDQCLLGHFGFSERGCRVCEPCTTTGHICHPTTGECVCPPFTEGPFCATCETNTWGLVRQKGCKPCLCNIDGSLDLQCNSDTGQCACRDGYGGERCNRCHFGYFAFPKCKPCRCDVDGTNPSKCRVGGLCECKENGQCPCKLNKEGKKCKQCKMGTFKLPSSHPKGCLECFCFGKSTSCHQAKYSWARVAHPEADQFSDVDKQKTSTLSIVNGLTVIPTGLFGNDTFDFTDQLTMPVYLSLPSSIKGDKVLSYTGHLYFTLESEGGHPFPDAVLRTYPLLQIQGNFRLVLEYYPDMLAMDGRYKVPLHEDYWKMRNNHETVVTRELMLVVLQNVQKVFVRATKSPDFVSVRLDDVALDVAIPAPPHSPVVAVGVELCQCPPQYNGTSCQDPADGFYRKRKKDFLNSKDILDLVGWAELCRCHNRSEKCDKETGVCQQCRDNTAGPHCEVCSQGYYGELLNGPCRPCACPHVNNSFSDFCELDTFGVVQCTQCKEGYTGSRCDRCSQGFYGDPLLSGGRCLPCLCNPRGSLIPFCDQLTGQCLCLEGLSGRDCGQCNARHILTNDGCRSCDDGCTGVLLDDLADLMYLASSVNVTGVIAAPWNDLYVSEDIADVIEKRVAAWSKAIGDGDQLATEFDTTFNLQGISSYLLVKARRLKGNVTVISGKASETKERAILFHQEVTRITNKIKDTVKWLESYTGGVRNASVTAEAALAEADKMLMDIRSRDSFSKARADAETELHKAQALLNIAKGLTNDSQRRENLTDRLRLVENTLNDALRLTQQFKIIIQETLTLNKTNWNRLQDLQSKLNKLENVSKTLDMEREGGGDLLNEAREELDEASVNFMVLEDEIDALADHCYRVGKFVNTLGRLLLDYDAKYVRTAEIHAEELLSQAIVLNKSFNTIRNESGQALRAITVYDEIRDAVNGAFISAKDANEAATKAAVEVLPRGEFEGIESRASKSKARSEKLLLKAVKTKDDGIQGLRRMLDEETNKVQYTNSTISMSNRDLQLVRDDTDGLGKDWIKDIDDVLTVSARTNNLALKVKTQVNKTVYDVDHVVWPKLKSLQMASPEGLDTLNRTVNDMTRTIGGLMDTISRLDEKKSVKMRHDLDRKLDAVKGLVLAARQRVSSLTLSLSGNDGKCVRSLRPDVKPSATSTISFKFAIESDARDSFLLFLGSKKHQNKASDFMAIEMVDRRIRFIWNVGQDTVAIEHKLQLKTNEQAYKFNDKWYHVTAQRIGNLGVLSVQPLDGTSLETVIKNDVSGHSAPGFSRMDLGLDSYFTFGQLPRNVTVPLEMKVPGNGFHGCIYDLQLDGQQVAVWNFIESIDCLACKQGPSEFDDVSTNEAYFNGEGYAISRLRTRFRRGEDRYSFTFTFKTLDENALLFFAPNNETGYFLMVSLEKGHVVFTVGVGDDADGHHQLRSHRRHNVDMWTQVEIRKLRSDTQLRIGNEPAPIHTLVPKSVGLKRGHDFYVGGLSPTEDTTLWPTWKNLTFTPFLGCLRGVQDDVTSITISDERIYGVERGCRQRTINRLAVPGKGYMELRGHSLMRNSSFGFTFLSSAPHGVLLISTFANEPPAKQQTVKDSYSVSLKDSQLHLYIGSTEIGGENVIQRLVHEEVLNLSLSHHVFVTRNNEKVDMYVNDMKVGSLTLSGLDPLMSPADGGLFIGGVPSNISDSIRKQAAVTSSLSGLIRDAVFDYGLLSFSNPVRFEHVGIGRSRRLTTLADTSSTPVEPSKGTRTGCQSMQVTVDELAVQFGDSPNSYVEKRLTSAEKQSEIAISFEFRTRYPNGLLLVLSGNKNSFVAVRLNNSHLVAQFSGRKGSARAPIRSRSSDGSFTNLTWQQSVLKIVFKKRRKIKLILNLPITDKKQRRLSLSLPKNFELGSVYSVGGVSPSFGPAIIPADSSVREPFRGCVRKFSVNRVLTDLSSGNVRHCFSTVTDGSYFGGDAYAVYAEKFNVGIKMDIQLEFRTTLIKGVLLSVSEKNDSPSLSIELHKGRVVMTVERGDGFVLRKVAPSEMTPFTSCDGAWHVVKASYESNAIRIRVDKTMIVYGLVGSAAADIGHRLNETRTRSPLYIGGLPDSAPKGSLMSRDNLIGCIRNVVINEKRYDWIDMPTTHNVLLNSCPTS